MTTDIYLLVEGLHGDSPNYIAAHETLDGAKAAIAQYLVLYGQIKWERDETEPHRWVSKFYFVDIKTLKFHRG